VCQAPNALVLASMMMPKVSSARMHRPNSTATRFIIRVDRTSALHVLQNQLNTDFSFRSRV
jgi:hypothetical protein